MTENTRLTGIELNGQLYSLGKTIYEELDMSLERFAELLGRDLYCPTLSEAPTSSTLTYTDTDGETHHFQTGQPCRWMEGGKYRMAVCKNITETSSAWYTLPTKVSELENDNGYATTSSMNTELAKKVDKVSGKGLSTNDFTTALKTKLEGLNNYDDTELSDAIESLRGDFDALVSGDTTTAIKTFNEVIAFLDGISDSEDLDSIIAGIERQIAAKQDTITDLETIRLGAAKGATALQSYTETDPTVPSWAKMETKPDYTANEVSVSEELAESAGVAECTVEAMLAALTNGFTWFNNTALPRKLDKTEASETYLGKNENAYSATKATQDGSGNVISSTYATKTELGAKGTYSKPSGGIPKTDLASAVQTSLGKADTALQSYTETDPVFKASAAAGITSANITSWNGKQDASLKFTDKAVSTWVSDSTYTDYPYRCDIACTGVTTSMYAEVAFSMEQATSGDYAPVCETKTNVVSIWSKKNTSITVPNIVITK